MTKRIISIFTVLCLVLSLTLFGAATEETKCVIRVDAISEGVGDTVTVPVRIEGNPGFTGFTFLISYDSELSLQKIAKGTLLKEMDGGSFLGSTDTNLVFWNYPIEVSGDGVILELTFAVSQAASGKTCPVEISLKENNAKNFVDESGSAIPVEFQSGGIVPSHVHQYTAAVTEPTCTENGYTTYTCDCGDSYTANTVKALGHSYVDGFCIRCNAPIPEEETKPALIAESVNAAPGELVSVPVYIKNNPDTAYLKLFVQYDAELTLVSTENKGLIPGIFTTSQNDEANPYLIQWMGTGGSRTDGCIMLLNFQIPESTTKNSYSIDIRVDESYNSSLEDLSFQVTSAKIQTAQYGDVNGDGLVDGRDSVLLAQYLAQWDVSIVEFAADVNLDGAINGKDGILLEQYLAEWDVQLGKKG